MSILLTFFKFAVNKFAVGVSEFEIGRAAIAARDQRTQYQEEQRYF